MAETPEKAGNLARKFYHREHRDDGKDRRDGQDKEDGEMGTTAG
jgi:hypothetical protein